MSKAQTLLTELNDQMCALHTAYEKYFWAFHMGDHSITKDLVSAQESVNAFRADCSLSAAVESALAAANENEYGKLLQWRTFFNCYQIPAKLLPLRKRIAEAEEAVQQARANRTEGYTDPKTGAFVETSMTQMKIMMRTHDDEAVRKACFTALDNLAKQNVSALIELVNLRNEYARALGDEDFYAYKLRTGEGMSKAELFALWDKIYKQTKYAFANVRDMERDRPGIRLPWNHLYMIEGDSQSKKDPYMQFGDALMRWGRSFRALDISFRGATLQLDLLDRKGKLQNGFCHWPELVRFKDGVRIPGWCNFTTVAVPGQIGSGELATGVLFHEGGHAAHLTNVETTEACMNHEYPPQTAAWAETQSMFLDNMQNSAEWLSRYAKDASGNTYPFSLLEEEKRRHHPIAPLGFMPYMMIPDFERELYSTPNLTEEKVLAMARRAHLKHTDLEFGSHHVLLAMHIYSWEPACCYHGYGLATLALSQWRNYFFRKYGHIVDNPAVGREMCGVWKLGASKTFAEFVEHATDAKLSADAYLTNVTMELDKKLALAKKRIDDLAEIPDNTEPVDLDASIFMVDGADVIADNSHSFEDMAATYHVWVQKKESETKQT